MGDNFLKQQVRNAKRRMDRVAADDRKPTLFVKPELVQVTYAINPTNGHDLKVGQMLFGVASRKGDHIDVTDGHVKLGTSDGDGTKALHAELSKPGGLTAIPMQVVEVGKLSGVAQARIMPNSEAK
jgi:hypothetical protein